jgi:hypothetical protein
MTPEPVPDQGWAHPTATARKFHYFADGRSLCGRYGYWGAFDPDEDPFRHSPDDCVECRRRFERAYGRRDQEEPDGPHDPHQP